MKEGIKLRKKSQNSVKVTMKTKTKKNFFCLLRVFFVRSLYLLSNETNFPKLLIAYKHIIGATNTSKYELATASYFVQSIVFFFLFIISKQK